MCDIWNRQKKECLRLETDILMYRYFTQYMCCKSETLPSLGIVRMGICVMEPFLPSTRPARYDLIRKEHINISQIRLVKLTKFELGIFYSLKNKQQGDCTS